MASSNTSIVAWRGGEVFEVLERIELKDGICEYIIYIAFSNTSIVAKGKERWFEN